MCNCAHEYVILHPRHLGMPLCGAKLFPLAQGRLKFVICTSAQNMISSTLQCFLRFQKNGSMFYFISVQTCMRTQMILVHRVG